MTAAVVAAAPEVEAVAAGGVELLASCRAVELEAGVLTPTPQVSRRTRLLNCNRRQRRAFHLPDDPDEAGQAGFLPGRSG